MSAASPPPTPFHSGDTIDTRYAIERELGSGGFGQVFLVRDRFNRDRELALKVLRPPQGVSDGYEQRFLNEIEILRSLHHDGIPRILNDGRTSDGAIYFTMEFVDGVTLSSLLKELAKKKERLAPDRVVRIVRRVLEILDYAHSRGVVHRDLKPGNIMLVHAGAANEDVRVLDFGIAKVLRGASSGLDLPSLTVMPGIGTPHYMAPEQLRSKDIDARADLYALGVILYQMCSGTLPFEGDSDLEIATARLEDDPKPLADDDPTPDWMRTLVFRMLQRKRDNRPSTREILAMLVGRAAPSKSEDDPRYAPTRSMVGAENAGSDPASRAAPSSSLHKTLIAFVAFAFVGALAFGAWSYFHRADVVSTEHDDSSARNDASNPKKREPPIETPQDSDGDGTPDKLDLCPNDPAKTAPGVCGCGVPDVDSDGDGVPDCKDECPKDPAKTKKGACGCGVADTDTDGDATPDCIDRCPNDPHKVEPGICGCGVADTDTDGDGTLDCNDLCPLDPNKIAPGLCGCGVADLDTDGDGALDCVDACPTDPAKTAPGICGCGVSDVDTDGDGTPDCHDECPNNPAKTVAGPDGCDPKPKPASIPAAKIATLAWADTLDAEPDPWIVTDFGEQNAIRATGLPWRVRHKKSGIELLLIPPGSYKRGAMPGDKDAATDEFPQHEVKLTKAFYLGRFEVTQGQWAHLMGGNPSFFTSGDDFPVEQVSWNDIDAADGFLKRAGGDLRLPTEAEWEFACRAGGPSLFESADSVERVGDVGWFFRNSGAALLPSETKWETDKLLTEWNCKTHAIGQKKASAWGLSDMHGNVEEWCADWYAKDEYSKCASGVSDPTGPASGSTRVLRGGSWNLGAELCRASSRYDLAPDTRYYYIGFRVARTP